MLSVLHKKQQNFLHPTHTGLGRCQIVEYSRLQWPGQLCVQVTPERGEGMDLRTGQ